MTDSAELNEIASQEETNVTTPETTETLNNEPKFDISERVPEPWESAPEGLVYYEKIYTDGHLGNFTRSPEFAYRRGYFENSIPEEDLAVSDVNKLTYLKSQCPMKSDDDLLKDQYRLEITQLKKQLSDSDYKAIKFAEGMLTEEEYAEVKEQRQGWRDRINELESLCGN